MHLPLVPNWPLNTQRVLKGGMPKAKNCMLCYKPTYKAKLMLGDNGGNTEMNGSWTLLTKINGRANNLFATLACSPSLAQKATLLTWSVTLTTAIATPLAWKASLRLLQNSKLNLGSRS